MNCLNRHDAFTRLLASWVSTGNPVYPAYFSNLVSDWVSHLPCREGVSRAQWYARTHNARLVHNFFRSPLSLSLSFALFRPLSPSIALSRAPPSSPSPSVLYSLSLFPLFSFFFPRRIILTCMTHRDGTYVAGMPLEIGTSLVPPVPWKALGACSKPVFERQDHGHQLSLGSSRQMPLQPLHE